MIKSIVKLVPNQKIKKKLLLPSKYFSISRIKVSLSDK